MGSQTLSLCCCLALLSGIAATSVSNNATDCPQFCPAIFMPVCGHDGFIYKEFASICNLKAFNCQRERSALTTYATTDMDWCRTEQVTDLQEKLGNIKLDINGCLKPCTMIYQPLCVSNGKYRGLMPSACTLETFNCALQAHGAKPTELLRVLRADSC
ncbi:m1 [Drosophila busckii]|uniref:M1 n=1 Tax=Drosophila busckii TaxID=30019 RepID=A0A0M4F5E2_DROBS|nr:enhancer of split M1 protein [Drosophila busckii]ALC46745.1 m1 [Drosophila busckii]